MTEVIFRDLSGMAEFRAGDLSFRGVKRCDRCVLTTLDPDTQERGHEPLRIGVGGKNRVRRDGAVGGRVVRPTPSFSHACAVSLAEPIAPLNCANPWSTAGALAMTNKASPSPGTSERSLRLGALTYTVGSSGKRRSSNNCANSRW